MLLQYAENNEPFDSPYYLASLKLDGIRLLVSTMDDVRLYTKNQDVTSRFPELQNPPLSKGTVIDCELISCDPDGHPDFEAVMSRFHSKKSKHRIMAVAFDILFCRGIDIRSLPLERRLEFLESELV